MKTLITSSHRTKEKPVELKNRRTFILMWNPKISSYSQTEFDCDLYRLSNEEDIKLDWSIAEWREARKGDNFYMVKVGTGKCGVVMSGTFKSKPHLGQDWRDGKREKILYVDLKIKHMILPQRCPLLTTKKLSEAIPNFEWSGGSSGRLLSSEQAEKLHSLWENYLDKHYYLFLPRAAEAIDKRDYIFID